MSTGTGRIIASRQRQRARLAVPLLRLRQARDPHAAPLKRAVRTTLLGRLEPAERAWIDRIEARRSELIRASGTTVPRFNHAERDSPNGGFGMGEPEAPLAVSAIMGLPPQWCVLLLRLLRELRPSSALELCTGVGISGSYQAAALDLNDHGRLTTLGSVEESARTAVEGFERLGLGDRVESTVGPIERTLAAAAERLAPLDFVFVDAEHEEQATRERFETLHPHLAHGAIVAFDDVHRPGVHDAFTAIAAHERVSSSALVGRMGVVVIAGGDARR